jgi:hypothetical protein
MPAGAVSGRAPADESIVRGTWRKGQVVRKTGGSQKYDGD